MSSQDIGCFGTICALVAFVCTWVSMIASLNVLGFIFGWIPAIVMALIVYICAEIALWLVWIILAVLLLIAAGLFLTGTAILSVGTVF